MDGAGVAFVEHSCRVVLQQAVNASIVSEGVRQLWDPMRVLRYE